MASYTSSNYNNKGGSACWSYITVTTSSETVTSYTATVKWYMDRTSGHTTSGSVNYSITCNGATRSGSYVYPNELVLTSSGVLVGSATFTGISKSATASSVTLPVTISSTQYPGKTQVNNLYITQTINASLTGLPVITAPVTSNVTVSSVSYDSATVYFTNSGSSGANITAAYAVLYPASEKDNPSYASRIDIKATYSSNRWNATITGLSPSTQYCVRGWVSNGTYGDFSDSATLFTTPAKPITIPDPPSNIVLENISNSNNLPSATYRVSWIPPKSWGNGSYARRGYRLYITSNGQRRRCIDIIDDGGSVTSYEFCPDMCSNSIIFTDTAFDDTDPFSLNESIQVGIYSFTVTSDNIVNYSNHGSLTGMISSNAIFMSLKHIRVFVKTAGAGYDFTQAIPYFDLYGSGDVYVNGLFLVDTVNRMRPSLPITDSSDNILTDAAGDYLTI